MRALLLLALSLSLIGCGSSKYTVRETETKTESVGGALVETMASTTAPGKVVLSTITRLDGTDSSPHEEVYVKVTVKYWDGRIRQFRKPAKHWPVENVMHRRASYSPNATIWSGKIPTNKRVVLGISVWESDPFYNPDDKLGDSYVTLTNVGGKIAYTFAPADGNTRFLGTQSDGNARFDMRGNNAKYYIDYVDPSYVKKPPKTGKPSPDA